VVYGSWFDAVVGKQHTTRIIVLGSHENHALPTLRQSEGPRVDDTVRPSESQVLKTSHNVPHRPSAIQLQHERDVLKDEPTGGRIRWGDEAKHLVHEPRLPAADSRSLTGLAEILTRKARCNDVDRRKDLQAPDVGRDLDVRKVLSKNATCGWLDFAEQRGFDTSALETSLQSADSGE
jgi:hypothetical protein